MDEELSHTVPIPDTTKRIRKTKQSHNDITLGKNSL